MAPPWLPPLTYGRGLVQHFHGALLDAWQRHVAGDFCCGVGFRGGAYFDMVVVSSLFFSSRVWDGEEMLLRILLFVPWSPQNWNRTSNPGTLLNKKPFPDACPS